LLKSSLLGCAPSWVSIGLKLGGAPAGYVVDRPRHLHHRSRLPCGRAVPQGVHHPCRPVRGTFRHSTRPQQRPGRGAPPSPLPGRRCGPGVVPRPRLLLAEWGTRRRHRPRSPLRAGAGAVREVVRVGPRVPPNCVARCGLPGRLSSRQGGGSPDCIAIAGLGAGHPDVGGGGSAGAGAALVRPPRAPYTMWDQSLLGPRATGHHPGLLPDSGLLTQTAAVPASSRYRDALRVRVATVSNVRGSPSLRAPSRTRHAARAAGHSSWAGQRTGPTAAPVH
jgi:hypothetical protein